MRIFIRWLEDVLNSTQTAGEKVLIFSHIPPGKFERFYQFCGEEKGCDMNGGYYGFHWLSENFNTRLSKLTVSKVVYTLYFKIFRAS